MLHQTHLVLFVLITNDRRFDQTRILYHFLSVVLTESLYESRPHFTKNRLRLTAAVISLSLLRSYLMVLIHRKGSKPVVTGEM